MRKTMRAKKAKTQGSNSSIPGAPQGIHRLPVELLDLVLQCLWEEKPAIIACSQVSRLWNQVAHPHLFAFLKIVTSDTYDFVEFHAFLAANPDSARHVRRLQLKRSLTPWTDSPQHDLPGIRRAQLRDLVVLLPRLQKLHLYELWVLSSPNPSPDAPDPEPTRGLEKMTIEHCHAPVNVHSPLLTVLNFVSLFTSVDTLELLSMNVAQPPHDATRLIRTVNVRSLIIGNVSLPPNFEPNVLYGTLREFLTPGCLRFLHTQCLSPFEPDSRPISDIVARLPGSLRSFGQLVESAARDSIHIHFPFRVGSSIGPGEDDPEHWRVLNLHACTSLASFKLEICVPPIRGPRGGPARNMPRIPLAEVYIAILANVPTTLRLLTIMLWDVREPAQIKSTQRLGLLALDAALAERHTHLARVQVIFDGEQSLSRLECSLALTGAMPKLHAKGVLAVIDQVRWRDSI